MTAPTVAAHVAAAAQTAADWDDELTGRLRRCGRQVGLRVELDLQLVAEHLGGQWADWFSTYDQACRTFWDTYAAGQSPGRFVALRRTLIDVAQDTRKGHKNDLNDQYDALVALPGVGQFVDELLSSEPGTGPLRRLGAPFGVHLDHPQDRVTRATLTVDSDVAWPAVLGGMPSPGEVRRLLHIGARYAKWRDRRVRRFTDLQVVAEEIWPDPADVAPLPV